MSYTPSSVRAAVECLEPYAPGLSIDEIRELYGLERIIKMASNENPLGVSPLVVKAVELAAGQVFRYAQSGNPRLARAVAALHGVDQAQVVLGNGSDELIDLLVRCRAQPGLHNVVTFTPCFSLYPIQTRLCGVELRQVPLREDFSFDLEKILQVADENTALIFITTPDNPSGYCPSASKLADIAKCLPKNTLLVIDEAYMDFAAYSDGDFNANLQKFSLLPRLNEFGNIAILRTFSKSYGLAGLRLGYGIMPADLADYLRRARLPFSVNILAEAAGLAGIEDKSFRLATLNAVAEGRDFLAKAFTGMGCKVYPSLSNFLMLGLPKDAGIDADGMFNALLRRGIIIRQLKSYKLPHLLRVSVGNQYENRILTDTMREIMASVASSDNRAD